MNQLVLVLRHALIPAMLFIVVCIHFQRFRLARRLSQIDFELGHNHGFAETASIRLRAIQLDIAFLQTVAFWVVVLGLTLFWKVDYSTRLNKWVVLVVVVSVLAARLFSDAV